MYSDSNTLIGGTSYNHPPSALGWARRVSSNIERKTSMHPRYEIKKFLPQNMQNIMLKKSDPRLNLKKTKDHIQQSHLPLEKENKHRMIVHKFSQSHPEKY